MPFGNNDGFSIIFMQFRHVFDRRPITSLNYLGTDDNEALEEDADARTRTYNLLHKRAKIIITGP